MSKDYARSLDKIHHKIRAHLLSLLRRSSLSAEPDSAAVLVLFAVAELRTKPDNKVCADCAMRDPTWASANLGVFLCLDCSGVHRSLGVHITQVRSITMDAWFPDQIKTMQTVGNAKARAFWEANVPAGHSIPNEDSSRAEMEVWIKDKYQNKKFVAQQPMSALTPNPVPRQCAPAPAPDARRRHLTLSRAASFSGKAAVVAAAVLPGRAPARRSSRSRASPPRPSAPRPRRSWPSAARPKPPRSRAARPTAATSSGSPTRAAAWAWRRHRPRLPLRLMKGSARISRACR